MHDVHVYRLRHQSCVT